MNRNVASQPGGPGRPVDGRLPVSNVGSPTESVGSLPANLILRSLPEDEFDRVLESATRIDLLHHRDLYGPGHDIDHVYFLESGMISLLTIGQDGRAIETGVVGCEGVVGGTVILGSERTDAQAIVQSGGIAHAVPASLFVDVAERSPVLRSLVHRHTDFLLFQARQNALCHALHSIEARLCRWLLQANDALGGDVLEVTQEFCAHILGVQRTSLSMVAHALQGAGSIRTLRGRIETVNRVQLERAACECYRRVKDHPAAETALAARSFPRGSPPDAAGLGSAPPRPATSAE